MQTPVRDGPSAILGAAVGSGRQSHSSWVARQELHRKRKVGTMSNAYSIKVRGVVQGVGFRPFIYRLACAKGLNGWVSNAKDGVEMHLEGEKGIVQSFLEEMKMRPPQAATIAELHVE